MLKKRNSKGFTIVELVVVIAVLGMLVLLATPKLLGYVESAKLAQIKNDVKAHETHIELKLATEPGFVDDWGVVSRKQMEELRSSSKLYDKKGLIEESSEVIFTYQSKIIPKKMIKTRLKGTFILDYENKVYYYDGEVEPVERLTCEEAELQGYICIYTVEDLKNIHKNMSAKYILMNDLNLSSIQSWHPIGYETGKILKFTGEFNGNNYSIKNFRIQDYGQALYSFGLFSDSKNASFKNLNFLNPSIIKKEHSSMWGVSVLSGRSYGSNFNNISIENFKMEYKESGSYSDGYSSVGAIVGVSENSSFEDVFINNSKIDGKSFVGGVTGYSTNSSYENVVVSNSKIHGESSFVGGVVGRSVSENVKNVRVYAAKIGTEKSFVGGVAGYSIGTFTVDTAKVNAELFAGDFAGGIVGYLGGEDSEHLNFENIDVKSEMKISNSEYLNGKEIFASGGIVGVVQIHDKTELSMKNVKSSGEIYTRENSGGIIGYFDENRGGYGKPTPVQKTFTFENVSSDIDFIETHNPSSGSDTMYFTIGGIIGTVPDDGHIKLNLKDVSYTGNMGLSEFYEITESNPIQAIIWRKISPIVSVGSTTYNPGYEDYTEKWKSLVETDNVYWIEENSPRLKPFDLIGLGK